jgi:predicted nucleic acid-binding protein
MTVFVDTAYWVARLNQDDQWYQQAKQLESQVKNQRLQTTDTNLHSKL